MSTCKPSRIHVDLFTHLIKTGTFVPISGFAALKKIHIPEHLKERKVMSIVSDIRQLVRTLFNGVDDENLSLVKTRLRAMITANVKQQCHIDELALEIIDHIMHNDTNLHNFTALIDVIHNMKLEPSVDCPNPVTIGGTLLLKIHCTIKTLIDTKQIEELAMLDQTDPDDLDTYNQGRQKIINLLRAICRFYLQRKIVPRVLSINVNQILPLMRNVLFYFQQTLQWMEEANARTEYDPDKIDYDVANNMRMLYTEQLYIFMSECLSDFKTDTSRPVKFPNDNFANVIQTFVELVIPATQEDYLLSKFEEFNL